MTGMPHFQPTYICIDLKSCYASVECVHRHLDPLTANLLVADESRSDKTLCLAVFPALKAVVISSLAAARRCRCRSPTNIAKP